MLRAAVLSSFVLASTIALGACSGSHPQEPGSQQTAAATTRAPVGAQTHGFVKIVGEALGEVPLRPEQRVELEKMATDADARHEAMRKARAAFVEELAAQVDKGALDKAALQAKVDATAEALEKARPADRAALQRMHDLLDASQRIVFADALKAKMHHAHAGHDRGFAKMREWADDLKLTEQQRDDLKSKLRDELHKHRGEAGEHHARGPHPHPGRLLDAFKEDGFKIDQAAPPVDAKAAAKQMSDRLVRMIEIALPVLTAEQRGIAAKKLRDHADALPVAPPAGP